MAICLALIATSLRISIHLDSNRLPKFPLSSAPRVGHWVVDFYLLSCGTLWYDQHNTTQKEFQKQFRRMSHLLTSVSFKIIR